MTNLFRLSSVFTLLAVLMICSSGQAQDFKEGYLHVRYLNEQGQVVCTQCSFDDWSTDYLGSRAVKELLKYPDRVTTRKSLESGNVESVATFNVTYNGFSPEAEVAFQPLPCR